MFCSKSFFTIMNKMTSLNLKDLPDDIESLKSMLMQAQNVIQNNAQSLNQKDKILDQRDKALDQKNDEIKKLKHLNQGLQNQLEKHLRHRFGQRSERGCPGQMYLFKDDLPTHVPPIDLEEEDKPKEKRRPRRRRPSEKMNLPEERIEHILKDKDKKCGECEGELKKFSEDISEEIVFIPGRLTLNKHARFKYVCPGCKGNIKSAAKPLQIIPKSNAGASLLTQILVSKFMDHLPYYRQCRMFERFDASFPESTMSSWMMKCADLLEPIAEYQKEQILLSAVIHTDDTVIPIWEIGKTREGRLGAYLGDKNYPYVYFRYCPDRRSEWIQEVIGEYEGYVQADAYGGFDFLFKDNRINQKGKRIKPATEVGCMAHNRRYFWEAWPTDPPLIKIALEDYFKKLYKIEKDIKLYTDSERKAQRQKRSKPILKRFYSWLESIRDQVSENAAFTKAINYAMNHKEAMFEYLNDGRLNIDNNPAERALRCVAIGRKNWTFAGNDRAGKAAAIFYSLIETCRLHKVNAYAYLHDALIAMADCRDQGDPMAMKIFTPVHWLKIRQEAEVNSKK